MRSPLFVLVFASIGLLFADEEEVPFSNIERGVPTLICNCVNTVSGDYVECTQDLVVPGPIPLTFDRFYTSNPHSKALYCHWIHNYISYVGYRNTAYNSSGKIPVQKLKGYFVERSRSVLRFRETHFKKKEVKSRSLSFSKRNIKKGYTNCLSGVISARTHAKNIVLNYQTTPQMSFNLPSGCRLFFDRHDNGLHYLKEEHHANGRNRLVYSYDDQGYVTEIQLRNHSDVLFSQINIDRSIKKDEKGKYFTVKDSHNEIKYRLIPLKYPFFLKKKPKTNFLISEIENPYQPQIRYQYCSKSGSDNRRLIEKRQLPCGRYKHFEYYQLGKNFIDKDVIKVPKEDEDRFTPLNRVKFIIEPAGENGKPVITSKFIYQNVDQTLYKQGRLFIDCENWTFVKNAHNHMKCYAHDKCRRLRTIFHCRGIYPVLRTLPLSSIEFAEWFVWNDEGELICQRFDDKNLYTKAAKVYVYDSFGNITQEKNYGNFSGNCQVFDIDDKGLPIDGKCECYQKKFWYYQNHLLKREEEDNGRSIDYQYVTDSDLIQSKTVNGIVKYKYEYNAETVLTKVVVEDGLTEKRVTNYFPRTSFPFGLPERIDESYIDLKTGKKHLLKRVVRDYSPRGLITKEDHYDSNENFCYQLLWEYNSHGKVIKEKNALGEWTLRKYDSNDNLIEEIGPGKEKRTFAYDRMDRLIKENFVMGDGTVLSNQHFYDFVGNRIKTIDHNQKITEYKYDEFKRLIKTIYPALPSKDGEIIPKTSQKYDSQGNVIAYIDKLGQTTHKTYTTRGKPTSIQYPDGTLETFEYNLDGTLNCWVSKIGIKTHYEYDNFGRITQEMQTSSEGELLSCQTFVYNAFHLISKTDFQGVVTFYSYDGAGRLIQEEKDGAIRKYEYDPLGRLYKTIDPYQVKIQQFDFLDRVIDEKIEGLDGKLFKHSEFAYDSFGNSKEKTEHTASGLSTTKMEYAAPGYLLKVTDPLGNETKYSYKYSQENSLNGEEITETDSFGNQTIITKNAIGRPFKIEKKNSIGQTLSFNKIFYNAFGNRESMRERVITFGKEDREVSTEWQYNLMNQLIEIKEANQKTTQFSYNSLGQLEIITKPDGIKLFHEYDQKGHLKRQYSSDSSIDQTFEYNLFDQLIRANETEKEYDQLNRLVFEKLENGLTISYEYDLQNRVTKIALPNGGEVEYEYEGPYLKKVHYFKNGLNYTHTYSEYDLSGNLLRSELPENGGSIAYGYDLAERLLTIDHPYWSQKLTYDILGNLTQYEQNDIEGVELNSLVYNDLYQLTTENGHQYQYDSLQNRVQKDANPFEVNDLNQITSDGECIYQYDENGNMLKEEGIDYEFDALDRLIKVTKGNNCYQYNYDALNRRISKIKFFRKNSDWEMIEREDFLYQGQNEIGSYKDGKEKETRILGMSRGSEIGAAVIIEIEGSTFLPIHNINGSICALIDPDSGKCLESYRYTAFGKSEDKIKTPWTFLSKRHDSETGFSYFGYRYYHPELGRWICPDPSGEKDGSNLYAFINNNPFKYIDHFGLESDDFQNYNSKESSFFSLPDFSWFSNFFDNFNVNSSENWGPRVLDLGRPEHSDIRFIYLNGMRTDRESMLSNMTYLSDLHQGYNVWGVFTPTGGIFSDFRRSIREFLGEETLSVKLTRELWKKCLEEIKDRPNGHIRHTAHSEGTIITYNALNRFDELEELNKCSSFRLYGFAKQISQDKIDDVLHFGSNYDFVSWFAGLFCCREYDPDLELKVVKNWDVIKILPAHPKASWFDHALQSPTYESVILDESNQLFNIK